jgi:hypothetical protein
MALGTHLLLDCQTTGPGVSGQQSTPCRCHRAGTPLSSCSPASSKGSPEHDEVFKPWSSQNLGDTCKRAEPCADVDREAAELCSAGVRSSRCVSRRGCSSRGHYSSANIRSYTTAAGTAWQYPGKAARPARPPLKRVCRHGQTAHRRSHTSRRLGAPCVRCSRAPGLGTGVRRGWLGGARPGRR